MEEKEEKQYMYILNQLLSARLIELLLMSCMFWNEN